MKNKRKGILFAVTAIVVILGINIFWLYSQSWFQGGYGGTRREELTEKFLQSFAERDYNEISVAEHGNVIVYLGEIGGKGNYAIFQKVFLLDRWNRADRQIMENNNHPMLIDEPIWGRIYLSLNDREIAKAIVVKNGEKQEISVDPQKPMVVITDYDIDRITFFTEDNQQISEEDFLNSPF